MDASDFGNYMKQQRELRGMSREQVAAATKIPLALMGALESGDFRRLPGRVFVINFIRSYAQVIGIAPDDAVLRYEEAHRAFAPEASEAPEPKAPPLKGTQAPRRPSPRALLWALVAFAVLLAGWLLWQRAGRGLGR